MGGGSYPKFKKVKWFPEKWSKEMKWLDGWWNESKISKDIMYYLQSCTFTFLSLDFFVRFNLSQVKQRQENNIASL